MEISDAKFTKFGVIDVLIDGERTFVPDDLENSHRVKIAEWVAAGNEIVPYVPEPLPDPVVIIPAVTLWERMTDHEAEQVNATMAAQPARVRQIFLTANTFRSDHELWPLLQQIASTLFGVERAAELLA